MICSSIRSGLALVIGIIASMWLAPPVYWLLQAFSEELPFLGALSFHRVWRRILLVCIIGALLVSLKTLDFGQLHLQKNRYRWYDFGWGFLFAAVPMVLLMATYVHFDVCRIRWCVELPSILRVTSREIGIASCRERYK